MRKREGTWERERESGWGDRPVGAGGEVTLMRESHRLGTLYINIYIYTYIHIYIHIYTYIYNERERVREKESHCLGTL